jgi:hypothetical protein
MKRISLKPVDEIHLPSVHGADSAQCTDGADSANSAQCTDGADSAQCTDGADSAQCIDGADSVERANHCAMQIISG